MKSTVAPKHTTVSSPSVKPWCAMRMEMYRENWKNNEHAVIS